MKKEREEKLDTEEMLEEQLAEDVPEEEITDDTPDEADQEESEHHHHGEHHHHSSHHHHHSHKHHHHSRKSNSKKISKRKIKKFFKKHKKILIPVAIILAVLTIMGGLLGVVELISHNNTGDELAQVQGTDGVVILATPVFEEEISLVNNAVQTILENKDYSAPAHVLMQDYLETTARLDTGMPVKLSFYVANKPADYTLDHFLVEVADNSAFEGAWEYTVDAREQALELYNLKTGTQYYYRINACFTNGVTACSGSTFRTKESPRILSIGGIYNARDIGGWKAENGKTIKQGLLFRGTELDGAVEEKYKLTEEGKQFMLKYLGIRTDMDLRWESENTTGIDALGEGVSHTYYGVMPYTDSLMASNQESVRKVFSDLSKKESYPVYMHCTYGRDRTGTICCLIEALLGVEEEDLWREYQLSALDEKYLDSSFDRFMVALDNLEGDTLQQKTENYLLSIGVTAEEIASIREIFLG